jgi:hypothetical protein
MSVQITAIRSIAIAAPIFVWGAGIGMPAYTAHADDCLAAPKAEPPTGQHWYYRTDRKKGRKCWFLRALDQPKQRTSAHGTSATAPTKHASTDKKATSPGKPASKSAEGNAPPSPANPTQPASTSSATTREPVRQHIQEQSNASSAPEAPAPQARVWTQPSARAPARAPTATSIWPDPPKIAWLDPPTIATATAQKSHPVPSDARSHSVPATAVARASLDSAGAARIGTPAASAAELAVSHAGTFIETSLVVALGLIVGGLLYRLVIKISAARGPRIFIDHSESEWIDDRLTQPCEFANKREAFIDDARLSLVPVAGDHAASRQLRANVTNQNYAPPKGRAARMTEQVIERESTLVQLMRDLDHMLKSRKGA